MAAFKVCPVGRRPSVSTVNEIATGIPARRAARAMLIASLVLVMVMALTMSALASAKAFTCSAW